MFERPSISNATMVHELQHTEVLRSPECILAFLAADRGHFWHDDRGTSDPLIYADMPLRSDRLHLSAPHIYAKALESFMPFRPGMSFLNVGSGTGYFNSIVNELIGDTSTNHGIDIWPEVIDHARQRCSARGSRNIEFALGNVYQLDVNRTCRYDRIYLGACANSRSKYLYRLLEVGGILIGPFQAEHNQQLRRVTRTTETQFNVEFLGSVHFACLVEPQRVPVALPQNAMEASPGSAITLARSVLAVVANGSSTIHRGSVPNTRVQLSIGLPEVPFTFHLSGKPWSMELCRLFPVSFKDMVRMSLSCRPRDIAKVCIPKEIWIEHIFPWCPMYWFDPPPRCPFLPPSRISAGLTSPALSALPQAALPQAALPPFAASSSLTPVRRKSDDELSDDGASTHAPSSSVSSISSTQTTPQTTPETGPRPPPWGSDENMSTEAEPHVEVRFDGQRYVIGADHDPDDFRRPMTRSLGSWRRRGFQEMPYWQEEEEVIQEATEDSDDDGEENQEEMEYEEDNAYYGVPNGDNAMRDVGTDSPHEDSTTTSTETEDIAMDV